MDTHIPGLSGRCFIVGSVHKNTGFWKMHRSAYRVQLPEIYFNVKMGRERKISINFDRMLEFYQNWGRHISE